MVLGGLLDEVVVCVTSLMEVDVVWMWLLVLVLMSSEKA